MSHDALDIKLNEVFPGKVVRKDLLLQVKKGTNVPSFVLEFLLARYCASDDPREIQQGMEAVLETIQKNYVRPTKFPKCSLPVERIPLSTRLRWLEREVIRFSGGCL